MPALRWWTEASPRELDGAGLVYSESHSSHPVEESVSKIMVDSSWRMHWNELSVLHTQIHSHMSVHMGKHTNTHTQVNAWQSCEDRTIYMFKKILPFYLKKQIILKALLWFPVKSAEFLWENSLTERYLKWNPSLPHDENCGSENTEVCGIWSCLCHPPGLCGSSSCQGIHFWTNV